MGQQVKCVGPKRKPDALVIDILHQMIIGERPRARKASGDRYCRTPRAGNREATGCIHCRGVSYLAASADAIDVVFGMFARSTAKVVADPLERSMATSRESNFGALPMARLLHPPATVRAAAVDITHFLVAERQIVDGGEIENVVNIVVSVAALPRSGQGILRDRIRCCRYFRR